MYEAHIQNFILFQFVLATCAQLDVLQMLHDFFDVKIIGSDNYKLIVLSK